MIFIFIIGLALIVSIIGICYARFVDYPPQKKRGRYDSYAEYWKYNSNFVNCTPWFIFIFSLICAAVFILIVIGTRVSNDRLYEQCEILRESYIELANHNDDYKDSVYGAIVDFNKSVSHHIVCQNAFNSKIFYSNKYDWNNIQLITLQGYELNENGL